MSLLIRIECRWQRFTPRYAFGDDILDKSYHVVVVRSQLTGIREIGTMYPEIRGEIVAAFDEVLDLRSNINDRVSALMRVRHTLILGTCVGFPLCMFFSYLYLPCVTNYSNELRCGSFAQFCVLRAGS